MFTFFAVYVAALALHQAPVKATADLAEDASRACSLDHRFYEPADLECLAAFARLNPVQVEAAELVRDRTEAALAAARRVPPQSSIFEIGGCHTPHVVRAILFAASLEASEDITAQTAPFGTAARTLNAYDEILMQEGLTEARLQETPRYDQGLRTMDPAAEADRSAAIAYRSLLVCELNRLHTEHMDDLDLAALLGGRPAQDRIWYVIWLLAQHADHAPGLQEDVLRELSPYQESGGRRAQYFAYLYDRIAINEGRAQLYGTQFCSTSDGAATCAIEEPEGLEARRAASGLN